jgi:hypothetical protein
MDEDEINMSLFDWQMKLNQMASEMDTMAENGFPALYDLLSLVTDAAAKIDEIRP